MSHWSYLVVLAGCLGAALPLHLVFGLQVFHQVTRLAAALLPGFVLFVAWDVYAIHAGQWTYDPAQLIGIALPGRIPLEELLFFVIVPLCAVLTFEAVGKTLAADRGRTA